MKFPTRRSFSSVIHWSIDHCLLLILLLFTFLTVSSPAVTTGQMERQQVQWDRFRGPNGTGIVTDAQLPDAWTEDDYLWRIELAGSGSSSPVCWDDKVFITSCDAETAEIYVQCLDLATGDELWRRSFESVPYRMHRRNSYAASTPAVDADHVYITYANPQHVYLVALDHSGNIRWRRDFGTWVSAHGYGASPIVFRDQVILVNSQQAERLRPGVKPGISRVISLDRHNGQRNWTTRLNATMACYAVPCVWNRAMQNPRLIGCNTGNGFYCLDLSDGRMVWSHSAFDLRTVASPLISNGLIYGSCGSGGGGNTLVGIEPDNDGAQTLFEVKRNACYVPCPIAVNGLLFTFSDSGIATCLDATTGEVHWRERLARGFSSSPVATSEHLYCVDEGGEVIVLRPAKQFKVISRNALGEASRATPAIAGHRLLFRTNRHLIAVGESQR